MSTSDAEMIDLRIMRRDSNAPPRKKTRQKRRQERPLHAVRSDPKELFASTISPTRREYLDKFGESTQLILSFALVDYQWIKHEASYILQLLAEVPDKHELRELPTLVMAHLTKVSNL